jgi:hypothetical protein
MRGVVASFSIETIEAVSFWSALAYMLSAYLYLLRETLKLSTFSANGTRFTKMLSTPLWRTEKISRELAENEVLRVNANKIERKIYLLGGIGILVVVVNILIRLFAS